MQSLQLNGLYAPIPLHQRADIRLVALQPSSDPQATVRCRLFQMSLDEEPEFEALSYVWGELREEKVILINETKLATRLNLWTALHYLRDSECERTLWIDAICINQGNIAERNHQVQQMCQIYMKSWRVLIWLGSESYDSRLALDFITFVGQTTRRNDTRRKMHTGVDREVQAIYNLYKRPYLTRLWIVQEVVLARAARLQCGRDHASWDDFDRFQNAFERRRIIIASKDTRREILRTTAFSLGRYQTSRPKLRDLLQAFSSSSCSELRDKIYGLAGLAKDVMSLRIDYSKSFFRIFEDVIATQQGGDLELFIAFCQFLQRLLEHNLSPPIPRAIQSSAKLIGVLGYCTGSISGIGPLYSKWVSFSEGLSDGFTLDGILPAGQSDLDDVISAISHNSIARCVIPIRSVGSSALFGGQETKAENQYNLNTDGYTSFDGDDGDDQPAPNELELKSFGALLEKCQALEDELIRARAQRILASIPTTAKHAINNEDWDLIESQPCFFTDSESRIDLAPSIARKGDIICRFRNCDIAALVRLNVDRYSIIGRALFFKRRGEKNIRTHEGSPENFHFSAPSNEELNDTMSFWLNTYTLQQLTQ